MEQDSSPLPFQEYNFLLSREIFLILSHLYGELWKKGDVLLVCNVVLQDFTLNPMLQHVCFDYSVNAHFNK